MKKVSLLLLTILVTIGCNQKQKEQVVSQESNPQLTAVEIKQEIQDSLKEAEKDSLALIAWGDVKFGMSMKEVLATETFKGGDKFPDSNRISMEFNSVRNLRKAFGLNESSGIWAKFQENELTRIYIESHYLTANSINDLVSDCDIFIKKFTEKYGEPSYKKSKVNISEFNSGEEFEYAKFQIGDKTITIVLGELSSEVKFYYHVYIDNDRFPQKKHVMTEKEIKEVRKQMEDTEKIRNNSF